MLRRQNGWDLARGPKAVSSQGHFWLEQEPSSCRVMGISSCQPVPPIAAWFLAGEHKLYQERLPLAPLVHKIIMQTL